VLPTTSAAVAEAIAAVVGNAAVAAGTVADQAAAAAADRWPQWRGTSSVVLWECPLCCPVYCRASQELPERPWTGCKCNAVKSACSVQHALDKNE